MKKRLEYIDMVKGIGILGIIVMHSNVLPTPAAVSWVSSFATPLFFLTSGLLIGCTGEEEREIGEIVRRKGRSLLLPFVCFSLLYFLRDTVSAVLNASGTENLWLGGIYLVTLWGSSVLWFLPALFLAEMFFLLLRRKRGVAGTCVATVILTIVSYFADGALQLQEAYFLSGLWQQALYCALRTVLRSLCALSYVCAGYVLFRAGKNFWGQERKRSVWWFLGGMVLFVLGIPISIINGYFDFRLLDIGTIPVLGYLSATISFAGVLLVCRNSPPVKPLAYFGRNSLIVMATHIDFYILYISLEAAYRVNDYIPRFNRVFFFVNVVGIILLLEIPCIEVINRFFPFLLGRKKEKVPGPGRKKAEVSGRG